MARIDDATLYNPFGWRLDALDDSTLSPRERDELLGDLLVWEAEEHANGYRHLTITHGDPTDLDASRDLSAFYATLRALAGECETVRVRGGATYVTITTQGRDAERQLDRFAQAAHAADPGTWTITTTPYPCNSGVAQVS